jgi:hypothetical protein
LSGHDGGLDSSVSRGVAEGVSIDDDSELSGDPLLVQFVRGPTFVNLVGIYSSELFQEPGISERDKWGVETMRDPLFPMMDHFGAAAVLSDGEVVEMMRMMTKIQGRTRNDLRVVSFTDYLQDKGIVVRSSGRYRLGSQVDSSLFFVMGRE